MLRGKTIKVWFEIKKFYVLESRPDINLTE